MDGQLRLCCSGSPLKWIKPASSSLHAGGHQSLCQEILLSGREPAHTSHSHGWRIYNEPFHRRGSWGQAKLIITSKSSNEQETGPEPEHRSPPQSLRPPSLNPDTCSSWDPELPSQASCGTWGPFRRKDNSVIVRVSPKHPFSHRQTKLSLKVQGKPTAKLWPCVPDGWNSDSQGNVCSF